MMLLIINRERRAFLWDYAPQNYALFGFCQIHGIDGTIPIMVKQYNPVMSLREIELKLADYLPRVVTWEREIAK